jgi:phosphatidylglycerophosphate synthase
MRKLHREAWFWLCGIVFVGLVIGGFVVWPFTPLTTLAIIAAIIRGGLVMMTGAAVLLLSKKLSYVQRAGLGGATVGMFMTTQSLLNPHTPWEAWASIVASGGWLLFTLSTFGPEIWKKLARIGDDD